MFQYVLWSDDFVANYIVVNVEYLKQTRAETIVRPRADPAGFFSAVPHEEDDTKSLLQEVDEPEKLKEEPQGEVAQPSEGTNDSNHAEELEQSMETLVRALLKEATESAGVNRLLQSQGKEF